tara:strand:+ start:390 stop:575 length:186 start_codon:yes stop_codon:yes gene_type:complete
VSWASKLVDNINTSEIIETIVDKVMDELDLDDLVKNLQERLVVALIERITTELSEAVRRDG